jgi:hypothetical protein
MAVQIQPCESRPVVAVDDAVRIQKGDDFKYHAASQRSGCWCGGRQKVQDPSHHPGAVGFTWVHTGGEDNVRAHGDSGRARGKVCDCQKRDRVPSQAVAKNRAVKDAAHELRTHGQCARNTDRG